MKTLLHFKAFTEEILCNNSRLYKKNVLEKYKEDEIVKEYLVLAFSPYIVFGISKAKLNKQVSCVAYPADSVLDLFYWLEKNNTGTDAAIKMCQETLAVIASVDQESADLLEKLICKDLSIGCDAKTINSVIPGLIPQFSCMLAEKYFDRPQYVEGKEFVITTKLDGFRLVVLKDQDGSITCYSRVGQPVEGLVEIEEELRNQLPCNIALDGELTISNYFDMPSKDAYKAASKVIRLKGDTPKTGLTYRVFDCMTADEFKAQQCGKSYVERRAMLESFPVMAHVEVLPVLYQGSDTSKITEWLTKITADGGEGCMINILSAPYVWNRTWNLLKVKKMNTLDLQIIGFEEGTGRLTGTLGAILVRYKNGNTVKVGSGFTDWLRAEIWNNQGKYLGRICEIQWFEETTNVEGGISLRFPIFKDFRDSWDKNTPDF